ncbi:MAG TPA: hypothetical protein DCZ12_01560 [Gammaproteobacteria bacterium]|nr:hypothetical protein [Gammaproteobacteria bacterium]
MDPYLSEWLNLVIRWIHVITGVAWIGASFYFNWLEGHLERNKNLPKGVAGDLWAVHGGGFYHVQKYEVAPQTLPKTLHWFKWEAYTTWLSGMTLLFIVYYSVPEVYLINTAVAALPPVAAIALSLGTLLAGWLGYHQLCKTALAEKPTLFFCVLFLALTTIAFFFSQFLNPRAAYIHTGALIGTLMVGNVFFVIIPSQRTLVNALMAGNRPDPSVGNQGFIRSLHNNYFTLPVLFIMVSNHFPSTFTHSMNWLVLAALSAIGIAVRHYFNLKNKGRNERWLLPAAALATLVLAFVIRPQPTTSTTRTITTEQAFTIVQTHCRQCHSAQPTDAHFQTAPNGVTFDTEADLERQAAQVYARTVATQSMPLGNTTHMSLAERELLGHWYQSIQQKDE